MKKICQIVCTILIAVMVFGCDNNVQQIKITDKTVKIGVIGPMSGPDKGWGENCLAGIKTAIQFQPVLDSGSKIELIVEDDQNQPELTQKAFVKLVQEDTVSSVLVTSNSKSLLSLAEIADKYETPIFALVSTHPDVTKDNSYISQLLYDDKFDASVAALYIRDELLVDLVGVVMDSQNPHSSYLAREFISKFNDVGGGTELVPVSSDKEVFTKELQSLQKRGVNFLYIPLNADHVVTAAQILDVIDYHPVLMGSTGLQATMLLQHPDSMDLLDGMLATDPYTTIVPPTEYGRKISEMYQDNFEKPGTVLTGLGAEGGSILIAAINRCRGGVERSCINRMLRSTVDFSGIYGKISIGENGKAERPIFLNRVDNRHLRIVVKVY